MKKIVATLAFLAASFALFAENEKLFKSGPLQVAADPALTLPFTPDNLAAFLNAGEFSELLNANLSEGVFAAAFRDGKIHFSLELNAKKGSDFERVLGGISIAEDLSEASFLSADASLAWASRTLLDEDAIEALARIFKQSAGKRMQFMADAILDTDIFNPDMGRFVESLETPQTLVLIAKTGTGYDALQKRAQSISALAAKSRNEDSELFGLSAEKVGSMQIILMPFGLHDIKAYTHSAATVVNGYEIAATGESLESARATLLKYAGIIEKNEPAENSILKAMGDAHRILLVNPGKLLLEMQNAFGNKLDVGVSYKYDLEENFGFELSEFASFDSLSIKFYFRKNGVFIETSISEENYKRLIPALNTLKPDKNNR